MTLGFFLFYIFFQRSDMYMWAKDHFYLLYFSETKEKNTKTIPLYPLAVSPKYTADNRFFF